MLPDFKLLCLENRENDSAEALDGLSIEEVCDLDECGKQHAWERWRICIYHLRMIYLKTSIVTDTTGEAFVQHKEYERMSKEDMVTKFFTVPYYLCGLAKEVSQGRKFPWRGLKREHPVYKIYVLAPHMPY